MFRTLAFLALLLTLPFLCGADELKKPAAPTKTAPANQPQGPSETVRLTVYPMASPVPVLKYQLLPELSEMSQGNPIQGYLKCFPEENRFFFSKESQDDLDKWSEMPLKDLPLEEIRNWRYFGSPLTQADAAARLDTPDWQILSEIKTEGAGVMLPDIVGMRRLSWFLKVRFRAEVAGRHFDKALVTAKTIFAMSRHLCEHPTLVGNQVGITILQETAIGPLEEMLQQPGCPNLYWALSALPSPLLSIYKGMQGERLLFTALFLPIDEKAPMSDEQLQRVVERFDVLIDLTGSSTAKRGDIRKSVDAKAKDETHLAAASKRLAGVGFDPKKVQRFPPLQVVLLDEMLAFRERRDDDMKAMMLPYWQIQSVLKIRGANDGEDGHDRHSLFVFLSPPDKARRAQVRLEQRIALLRCVEALRMYAADHDGQLPKLLDDVPVPVPIDPVSGKAFSYRLDGATATVRGTPVQRETWYTFYNFNAYEVTVKK